MEPPSSPMPAAAPLEGPSQRMRIHMPCSNGFFLVFALTTCLVAATYLSPGGTAEAFSPDGLMAAGSSPARSSISGAVLSPLVLYATKDDNNGDGDAKEDGDSSREKKNSGRRKQGSNGGKQGKASRGRRKPDGGSNMNSNSTVVSSSSGPNKQGANNNSKRRHRRSNNLSKRVAQLEGIVAGQSVEIRKLREECRDLRQAAATFAQVVEMLREAGLSSDKLAKGEGDPNQNIKSNEGENSSTLSSSSMMPPPPPQSPPAASSSISSSQGLTYDYYEDEEIFGSAPSSVIDAADAAGAAILAALLAGKQRMLVDVRDAELSRDPDILVQFIELAVLPVAAGLEGIEGLRNRVKIVFPTVSQLMKYRKTMALAGTTDVLTISTLGFDPVQEQDSLVVIIAPSPDDEEGIEAMSELLSPSDPSKKISQPVVVLNHHTVPVSGIAQDFSVAYHLRLLSVQYMTGDMTPEYIQFLEEEKKERQAKKDQLQQKLDADSEDEECSTEDVKAQEDEGEEALEAAMNKASDLGVHHGITRAMVIRAYPRPWHVFVDTSPDSDADFEVAATFDTEPSQDEVNYSIVECLEGSETEDELVAQQMQAALESGQLNRVSEMLDREPSIEIEDGDGNGSQSVETSSGKTDDTQDEDEDDLFYDDFAEDSL